MCATKKQNGFIMKISSIKSLVVLGVVLVVSAPAYATKNVLMPDGFVFAVPDNQTDRKSVV